MAGEVAVDLVHRFESGVDVRALLTRTIAPGSILVLFGPSGAGKTTILRAIAGLLRPDRGRIAVGGAVWFDSAGRRFVPPQQRRVGYVTQESALFPHLTVRANIEYGLRASLGAARRRNVDELIDLVGVHGLEHRFPKQLSGGQAQRVAVARALAPGPALLLLDEPFGALDAVTRRGFRTEVRAALRETGTSAILVTHDRLEAMALGDDLAVMVDGDLRQVGSMTEVLRWPADSAVARSLGVETVVGAVVESGREGLVDLRIGRARLVAIAGPGCSPGTEVFACVRAEDVIVQQPMAGSSTRGSTRNHLVGVVVGIEHDGLIDRVAVDCGFTLVAAITRQSREKLGVEPGSAVTAAIETAAVHIVPKL